MVPEIGNFALILALSLAICQAVLPLVGAHRGDAAVHHVGRSDDIGPGARLAERLFDQRLDRAVVLDVTGLVHQPVLAVAGDVQQARLSLQAQGRAVEIVPQIEERLEQDPDDVDLRLEFVEILAALGRGKDGSRHLEEALRRRPGDARGWILALRQAVREDQGPFLTISS